MLGKTIRYTHRKIDKNYMLKYVKRAAKVYHQFESCGRTVYLVAGKTRPYVMVVKTEADMGKEWGKYRELNLDYAWEECVASLIEKQVGNA